MLRRKPILTGTSDLDQLDVTFQLVGSPTLESWPDFQSLKDASIITQLKNTYVSDLYKRFKGFDLRAIDLLESFLRLDPKRRITPREAMQNEYFLTAPLPSVVDSKDFKVHQSSHEYTRKQAREG